MLFEYLFKDQHTAFGINDFFSSKMYRKIEEKKYVCNLCYLLVSQYGENSRFSNFGNFGNFTRWPNEKTIPNISLPGPTFCIWTPIYSVAIRVR